MQGHALNVCTHIYSVMTSDRRILHSIVIPYSLCPYFPPRNRSVFAIMYTCITSMFFEIDVRTSRSIFLNCSLYNFIQSCFYRSCTKTHSVAFFGSKRKCIFVCLFCRWSVTSGWMYITLLLERVSGLLTDVICSLHLVTGVDSWSCL